MSKFAEKRKEDGGWINGGYMVMEPEVFDYIEGDMTTLEREPFERLTANNMVGAYKHNGFWQCMDTMKEMMYLDELIIAGKAPWIKW